MISQRVLQECRTRLIQSKEEILNQLFDVKRELGQRERGGDEADQSVSLLAENHALSISQRLRFHLLEIEYALARIDNGSFGVCEETDEPIEEERLLAIPWTRLGIEGAEIREALDRRFAR